MQNTENAKLIFGFPGKPFRLAEALSEEFVKKGKGDVAVKLGFAYASSTGLDALVGGLEKSLSWPVASKEWVIGLHHGITEPLALKRILALPNSSLRLYLGGKRLSEAIILGGVVFHGKIACMTVGEQPVLVSASSANLTGAALSAQSRNYEAGISLHNELLHPTEFNKFSQWWDEIWTGSVTATERLINQYANLRDRFLTRNPDTVAGLDVPSLPQLGHAKTLWIDAGAMSGGSRNQVEFSNDLASYFGPPKYGRRLLRMRANGQLWDDRPLSYKVTTFGVEIWRLSLPTKEGGGFEYPGKVIKFTKLQDREGQYFKVAVADTGSRQHAGWRSDAHRFGYIGMTSGQRTYGFS